MRAASFQHSLLSVDLRCLHVVGWLCISASLRLNVSKTKADSGLFIIGSL